MNKKQWLAMTAGGMFAVSSLSVTAFASTSTYTVRPGDSYYKIAQTHHQPYTVLETINTPGKDLIFPGQLLQLATPYTVHSGDSVWTVSRKFDVTVSDLVHWNQLHNPNYIVAGSTLWLKVGGQAPARTTTATVSHPKTKATTTKKTSSTTHTQTSHPKTTATHKTTVTHKATPTTHRNAEVTTSQPAPRASSAPTSHAVTGEEIVTYAKTFMGTPYHYGGTSRSGFDCSGLVETVFSHFNIALPRTSEAQHSVGTTVSRANLKPGDLVFFNTTGPSYSHVGIYVGNGQFISATSSHGVTISALNNPYYWGPRYTGATNPLA